MVWHGVERGALAFLVLSFFWLSWFWWSFLFFYLIVVVVVGLEKPLSI
jgi:hypothetical protein